MFSPHEILLWLQSTRGRLSPNGLPLRYLRCGLVGVLSFCLYGPLFSSPVLAQSKDIEAAAELDPEKDALWKALNARAVEAIKDRRVVDAVVAWKAAHQIKPMYYTACDIGGVELDAGNSADAAYYLSDCLKGLPPPKSNEDFARKALIESKLKQAKSQAGTIQMVVLEKGASISVDGQFKGVSPVLDVFVPSGLHGLVVEKEGFQREESEIAIEKGETKMIVVKLKPSPPKPADEAKLKEKPSTPEKRNEQKAPNAEAPKKSNGPAAVSQGKRSKALIFTGIGLSGAGVAVGTALLIAANDWEMGRIEKIQGIKATDGYNCVKGSGTGNCISYGALEQQQIQLTNGAILSFSIAGAVGLSTLAYSLIPWKGFDIALGPSGAMVRGTW